MTDDLIEQLRCYPANRLCRQVADALEAKDARIAELEAAIDLFIAYDETDDEDMVAMVQCYDAAIEAARKVLRSGEKNDNE